MLAASPPSRHRGFVVGSRGGAAQALANLGNRRARGSNSLFGHRKVEEGARNIRHGCSFDSSDAQGRIPGPEAVSRLARLSRLSLGSEVKPDPTAERAPPLFQEPDQA